MTRRRPARGPRLFDEPVLLRRTRRDIGELVGLVWLAVEVARLASSGFGRAAAVRSRRGHG